ncbi:Csu type fimbrial protein [Lysobacter sp. A3-1-A15]|uniref:Csu type fimbrial protein n=1 Tax=Novilysobacter viscosus TaxID=3098602 RepID=UPI002EDA7E02
MSMFTRTTLAVALLAAAPLAFADTATDTMNVSIEIENACTVDAADMSFGPQSDLSSAITSTADVTVDCTNQGAIEVAFSTGGSGDFAQRTMAGPGGATIDYQLYDAATGGAVLGDGSGTTATFAGTSTGSIETFTVHGVVPAQGAKPVGNYSDAITATLTY